VIEIKTWYNVATRTGTRRKLGEKGRDKVAPALLVNVPKIKIEISYQGSSGLTNGFDVLDDRGTNRRHQQPWTKITGAIHKPENALARASYKAKHINAPSNVVVLSGIDAQVFRGHREANRLTSSH
jgi:hypothetical protein